MFLLFLLVKDVQHYRYPLTLLLKYSEFGGEVFITALTLVLDGGDCSLLSPIHGRRHRSDIFISEGCADRPRSRWASVAVARGSEFFIGLVCKFIDSQLVRPIPSFVSRLYVRHIALEYMKPLFLLCIILVCPTVASHPLLVSFRHRSFRQRAAIC